MESKLTEMKLDLKAAFARQEALLIDQKNIQLNLKIAEDAVSTLFKNMGEKKKSQERTSKEIADRTKILNSIDLELKSPQGTIRQELLSRSRVFHQKEIEKWRQLETQLQTIYSELIEKIKSFQNDVNQFYKQLEHIKYLNEQQTLYIKGIQEAIAYEHKREMEQSAHIGSKDAQNPEKKTESEQTGDEYPDTPSSPSFSSKFSGIRLRILIEESPPPAPEEPVHLSRSTSFSKIVGDRRPCIYFSWINNIKLNIIKDSWHSNSDIPKPARRLI